MRDKMRLVRKSYQHAAWIGVGSGFAARKGRIVNLSDSGALLLLDDPAFLIDRFKPAVRPGGHIVVDRFSRPKGNNPLD